MHITKRALTAIAGQLAILSAMSSQAQERQSETSRWDEAALQTYLLEPYQTTPEDKPHIKQLESELEKQSPSRFSSELDIQDNVTNGLRGKARLNWKNHADSLFLYIEGAYEAKQYDRYWRTELKTAIGMKIRPSETVSFSLKFHDRKVRDDSFESQSVQGQLAFAF